MSDPSTTGTLDGDGDPGSTDDPVVGSNSPGLIRRIVQSNNRLIARTEGPVDNPRDVRDQPWAAQLSAGHDTISAEWARFVAAGLELPLAEDLFGGPQGNESGTWRTGLLLVRRRRCPPLANWFPRTIDALLAVPGMSSAMVSVFGPDTELPEHRGDNAGGLRLLYGISCPEGSGHSVAGVPVEVSDGDVLLFDDTELHAAWNRSAEQRVLLLADVARPLPTVARLRNESVQFLRHHLSGPYRHLAGRSSELHAGLNGTSADAPPG